MMMEGVPCLYYGTEQEFNGGNDPANREVLWNTNFDTTGDTFVHFAKLARIRRTYDALRKGNTNIVYSTPNVGSQGDAGIFAFERAGGDAGSDYALVVLNTNEGHASATFDGTKAMAVTAPANATLVDVMDPNLATYTVGGDGTLNVTVSQQSAMVLIPTAQVVKN
jgi:glycosidase